MSFRYERGRHASTGTTDVRDLHADRATRGGAYSASKYAIESLADALRIELRPWKIPVSLIEPGPIRTDMWGGMLDGYDAMTAQLSEEHGRL